MQVAAPQLLQLMNIRVQGGGRYIQLHSYTAPLHWLTSKGRVVAASCVPAVPLYGGHVVAARPVSPRPAPPAASPADLRQEGLWPVAVPHRPKCTSAQWARGGHWGPGHCTIDIKQWVE